MNYLPVILVLCVLSSCAPATDGERAAMECQDKLKEQSKLEDKLKECQSDIEYYNHRDYLDSLVN